MSIFINSQGQHHPQTLFVTVDERVIGSRCRVIYSLILVDPSSHLITTHGQITLRHESRPHHRLEIESVKVVGRASF